jgi:hypothetical protein
MLEGTKSIISKINSLRKIFEEKRLLALRHLSREISTKEYIERLNYLDLKVNELWYNK